MKGFKKFLMITLLVFCVVSLFACGGGPTADTKKPITPTPTDTSKLKPSDIKKLADLQNYGSTQSTYEKSAVAFDKDAKTYDKKDCTSQITKLNKRITQKHEDVMNRKTTSSFVKIFASSTPEGLLQEMAIAALTFDEMSRLVDYLYGSEENPDLDAFLKEGDNDTWTGVFSDKKTGWREKKNSNNTAAFNAGWSFFDDWDMYERLKEYAQSLSSGADKDLAGDNAAWHYRSILTKVYTEVNLPGDAAARVATHMLKYAVVIVEGKSGGKANDAIPTGSSTQLGSFVTYCQKVPAEGGDPFSGLADYETASYLLAFNEYYGGGSGLKNCVTLYGYYYDYNKTYYKESLADEATYAKQLKYEKQDIFTEEEWLDYVSIQRNNYVKAYRYSEECYRQFYTAHFGFQEKIEDKDGYVYAISAMVSEMKVNPLPSNTSYTGEMVQAIRKAGSTNGLAGQLAMSDWEWCYSGDKATMVAYNAANTEYQRGKESSKAEDEYKGKFDFEMEQLKMAQYLLTNMSDNELGSALYYNVYSYSASMVKNMTEDIKHNVYIKNKIEEGSHYTTIAKDVPAASAGNYAMEKIAVIYSQTKTSWENTGVSKLANNAMSQQWSEMNREVGEAINYPYSSMTLSNTKGEWEQKSERLEDLVVVRVWSCCGQKVHEAEASKCDYGHRKNKDGSTATKDYATDHAISYFVSNYENVLMHIGGKAKLSFNVPAENEKGYQTQAVGVEGSWVTGYDGTIQALINACSASNRMTWSLETKTISISSGKSLGSQVDDLDKEDKAWWNQNKDNTGKLDDKATKYGPIVKSESSGTNSASFRYTYTFKTWYLDKTCKYEFDEKDDVNVNLLVYAGYDVKKEKAN